MESIIERYGCLIKVENLWCLSDLGVPNTCLLESLEAFPGYYGDIPKVDVPKFIYLVAGETYTLEQITRISQKVKKEFPHPFDAAFCEITMRESTCCAIRITKLEDYSLIRNLQEAFQKNGIVLKKKIRNIENEPGLIKVRKFFNLKKGIDGIYLDNDQNHNTYFVIPHEITWKELESNIKSLRNNWNNGRFDAAKCFIYHNKSIIDMIRIYSHENSLEFTRMLRDKYYLMMKV